MAIATVVEWQIEGVAEIDTPKRQTVPHFTKIHDSISRACFYGASLMMLGMVLAINYDVLARYFFNRPTKWVLDLTSYALLWSTFLSAAWLLHVDAHTRMTLLVERVESGPRRWLALASGIVGSLVFLIITWHSLVDVLAAYHMKTTIFRSLIVSKAAVLSVIPLGSFLIFLYFVRALGVIIRGSEECQTKE